jgi:hypothetical protein
MSRSAEARSGSSRKHSFFLESSVMDLSELEADSVGSRLIKLAATVGDGMSFPCEDERSNRYLAEVRGLIRNTHTFGRLKFPYKFYRATQLIMLVHLRSMGCLFIICLLSLIFSLTFHKPAGVASFFMRNGYTASFDPQRGPKATSTRQVSYS